MRPALQVRRQLSGPLSLEDLPRLVVPEASDHLARVGWSNSNVKRYYPRPLVRRTRAARLDVLREAPRVRLLECAPRRAERVERDGGAERREVGLGQAALLQAAREC